MISATAQLETSEVSTPGTEATLLMESGAFLAETLQLL
jgi:hypothetical protein